MINVSAADVAILVGYVAVILGVGVVMGRRARRGLSDYFLGDRTLRWWLLGIAGAGNWFDLTGTMVITSFLFMLGPRGLFIEFRGGACLVLAFMIAYTGKWHRRSGCMTKAEWMTFRFGTGGTAAWLRVLTAVRGIIFSIGILAYLVRGTSGFVAEFVPFSPLVATALLLAVCGFYTMLSGFYGVVFADLVQGAIKICAALALAALAFIAIPDLADLSSLAARVTGNAEWTATVPAWHTTLPRAYESYQGLLLFAGISLLRNLVEGPGSGAETRYFAARSDRDCGLLSALQGAMLAFRWPMMIGFAVLGLMLVDRFFPDSAALARAAAAIRGHYSSTPAADWREVTAQLSHRPDAAPPALRAELQAALGANWPAKLSLVGVHGPIDPEQVVPAVIAHGLPTGLRGLLLVAMLAATMSTFAGWINQAGAYFVRDIYQYLARPAAGRRELIACSYTATAAVLAAAFWFGVRAANINDLWGWLMMSVTAGTLAPDLLRLYWWRCNAWGVIAGTVCGGVGAIVQRLVIPDLAEWRQLALMATVSFVSTIIGSLMTTPPSLDVLRRFYRTTRPFGWWAPLRAELPPATRATWDREHGNDILAVPFLLGAQVTLFLLPMQLVIHAYRAFVATLPVFGVMLAGAYWFWWRNLPPANGSAIEHDTFSTPASSNSPSHRAPNVPV